MDVNETIQNASLTFPSTISLYHRIDYSHLYLYSFPFLDIDRDAQQRGSQYITVNIHNDVHFHFPRPVLDNNTDRMNGDDEDEDQDDSDDSDEDSNGDESTDSDHSTAYATPPAGNSQQSDVGTSLPPSPPSPPPQ